MNELTLDQASIYTGLTTGGLRMAIYAKKLKATKRQAKPKTKKVWHVTTAELDRFMQNEVHKTGRPRTKS